jgi:NADP-dependent 3-hydroxy acid dehydrogenase YdfG
LTVRNNAGVGALASFDDLTLEDCRWMAEINLYGVVHGMKAFLPAPKRIGQAFAVAGADHV